MKRIKSGRNLAPSVFEFFNTIWLIPAVQPIFLFRRPGTGTEGGSAEITPQTSSHFLPWRIGRQNAPLARISHRDPGCWRRARVFGRRAGAKVVAIATT